VGKAYEVKARLVHKGTGERVAGVSFQTGEKFAWFSLEAIVIADSFQNALAKAMEAMAQQDRQDVVVEPVSVVLIDERVVI